MNKILLQAYIDDYKLNFPQVNRKEIYKWKAVKTFQDTWDINALNFSEMLLKSISRTANLLKSGQYFPLRMLRHYSLAKPEALRDLFTILFDEEVDLFARITDFQHGIETINRELFPGKSSYQDERAIIVYLTLRYPDRYYFYKYKMFKVFANRLQTVYTPVMGRIENISQFENLCEIINHELSQDQDLLKMHSARLSHDCYFDEGLNILTQDFIYAVAKHLNIIEMPKIGLSVKGEETIDAEGVKIDVHTPSFRGQIINFLKNSIENKRIGDLGEQYVIEYEKLKLHNLGKPQWIKKIKHISKEKGDGTGFDILSCNEKGKPIFIEVKTTKYGKNANFYVTRTELERSKLEDQSYYLYRVYEFDELLNQAKIYIINGDLSSICVNPELYKVAIN